MSMTRRTALGTAAALAGGALLRSQPAALAADAAPGAPAEPFKYCLNTSTINGSGVPLNEQFEIAAKAGFNGVEPWLRDIEKFEKAGGSLVDLGKRIKDLGLEIPSAIGFAKWIVDDEAERAKGLEQMKHDMEQVAKLGGKRIAAPPIGANDAKSGPIDLMKAAERYRVLLDLGDQTGVTPEVEFWGSSKNLNKLAEAALVATASGHPKACILPDIYHMYKGGSPIEGLRVLAGTAIHCIHTNDYPADPPRETINDSNRIYPGDGIAPLKQALQALRDIGFRGHLSLELFNRDYWKMSPQKVAQTGIEKLKAAVAKALA